MSFAFFVFRLKRLGFLYLHMMKTSYLAICLFILVSSLLISFQSQESKSKSPYFEIKYRFEQNDVILDSKPSQLGTQADKKYTEFIFAFSKGSIIELNLNAYFINPNKPSHLNSIQQSHALKAERCLEYTDLTLALCRHHKIPAIANSGFVYLDVKAQAYSFARCDKSWINPLLLKTRNQPLYSAQRETLNTSLGKSSWILIG